MNTRMIALAALLAPAAVAAEEDGTVDFELFHPSLDNSGYFAVPGARTLGNLELATALWFNHSNDPVVLTSDGQRLPPAPGTSGGDKGDGLVDSRFRTELHVGMGFTGKASVALGLPINLAQTGTDPTDLIRSSPRGLPSTGLGDLRVEPAYVPLSTANNRVGVGFRVPVTLPTGRQDALMGSGGVQVSPGTVVELANGDVSNQEHTVRAAVHAAYSLRPADRLHDLRFGNAFVYGAAAAVQPMEVIELVAEIHGELGGPQNSQAPGEAIAGIHFIGADLVDVRLGGGTGLFGGVGAPDWRVVAGITVSPSFDPAARDADGDGIADEYDKCVSEPEDPDGYQDVDGCPDNDNDADTILDKFDECPDDPEDVDGFEDKDGCPDKDNDGDGVADFSDRCPLAPETVNDYRDDDGCPDTPEYGDRDGDGYTDRQDRCPNEAETFNGIEDDDGCPEKGRVSVEKGAIKISERIYFETGRAEIQSRSHSLLDEIAQVLIANPRLKKVRIEGHTDNVPIQNAQYPSNWELASGRSIVVLKAMLAAGLTADRVSASSFADTHPVSSNDTKAGRAANRRIEIVVVPDLSQLPGFDELQAVSGE